MRFLKENIDWDYANNEILKALSQGIYKGTVREYSEDADWGLEVHNESGSDITDLIGDYYLRMVAEKLSEEADVNFNADYELHIDLYSNSASPEMEYLGIDIDDYNALLDGDIDYVTAIVLAKVVIDEGMLTASDHVERLNNEDEAIGVINDILSKEFSNANADIIKRLYRQYLINIVESILNIADFIKDEFIHEVHDIIDNTYVIFPGDEEYDMLLDKYENYGVISWIRGSGVLAVESDENGDYVFLNYV